MVRKVKAFLMAVCLLFAVEATATSGNEWKQLTETQRLHYIAGVLDAWDDLGAMVPANQQSSVVTSFAKLVRCAGGMYYTQIDVIVQKYMENHPAKWHGGMVSLLWLALNEACEPTSK